jgi:hypothetical protein
MLIHAINYIIHTYAERHTQLLQTTCTWVFLKPTWRRKFLRDDYDDNDDDYDDKQDDGDDDDNNNNINNNNLFCGNFFS